ncbi:hypothetical protein SLEP1_g35883 [Rubroshorea leprosula]|uniref:Uncharacterized protein n=1 Tax=Rubroshorea leprosula TaxID=152421 RepID=A0AAV5KQ62_9ROSI|nr:hypothetical protein SLEP1_g35883 [Rubroshorea leprosula]
MLLSLTNREFESFYVGFKSVVLLKLSTHMIQMSLLDESYLKLSFVL